MRVSGSDPGAQLLRALQRSALAAGCAVAVEHEATVPWASATFVGAQHRVRVTGEALAGWLLRLANEELPLRGCFVAECAGEVVAGGAVLTLLVLEE